ncbi:hypothetical protein MycrhDRAFT_5733 [Mycolicibacterium rhodesiae JS60]|nr:hypothetical protein MycrhDRAFT_5733 [Mycolicibacterium rhodesiae JS60]
MTTLTRSKDTKVANIVKARPSGVVPLIGNAFGLPSGAQFSCPDATAFCSKVCYAGKIERLRPAVSALLLRNWEATKDASLEEMTIMLGEMITEFIKECDKRNAPKMFRIHWDGDFFSGTYVAAWARVIRDNPDVQFWAYTRVATAATYLHSQRFDNLGLYFSADEDNLSVAKHLEAKGSLIAHVANTFEEGKTEFASAARCPNNNGALPTISAEGSACARCGLCINGRKSVLFKKH